MKLSVGEATGLDIDYYVEINLAGFEKMINALGGITVNINTYIPIGGNTDLAHPAEGVPGARSEPAPQGARRPLVRPRPVRLGRLRPDGPAALRDRRR